MSACDDASPWRVPARHVGLVPQADRAIRRDRRRARRHHPRSAKADPHVELQDGAVSRDYLAREVEGDEKAEWWARAVEAWPDYAAYQRKTARPIPVFVLEPLAAPGTADAG